MPRHAKYRMIDWGCSRCANMGSTPVSVGTSALNQVVAVSEHHSLVAPDCAKAFQSRWVELIAITTYKNYGGKARRA
jgi:hypothetical protein